MQPNRSTAEPINRTESSDEQTVGSRVLPSGRSVVVKLDGGPEEIEVRSPEGEVEVRITLTEDGPLVELRGARLELESLGDVAIRCRRFEVSSTDGTDISSDGDVRITGRAMSVKTEGDVRLNGAFIRLNCPEEDPSP